MTQDQKVERYLILEAGKGRTATRMVASRESIQAEAHRLRDTGRYLSVTITQTEIEYCKIPRQAPDEEQAVSWSDLVKGETP